MKKSLFLTMIAALLGGKSLAETYYVEEDEVISTSEIAAYEAFDAIEVYSCGTLVVDSYDYGSSQIDAHRGTAKLVVSSGITFSSDGSTFGYIVVEDEATFSASGGALEQTIENTGTVTLAGLSVNDLEEIFGTSAHFDLNGQVTEGDNYFTGISESYVEVVRGGTTTGNVLRGEEFLQVGSDGKLITQAAEINNDTFYVGGEVATSEINGSSYASGVETVVVGDYGTLNVDAALTYGSIKLQDGARVAGDALNPTDLTIEEGAVVGFEDGLKVSTAVFDEDVTVENKGDEARYSESNADMAVTAKSLTFNEGANAALDIANELKVENIINQSGYGLNIDQLASASLGSLSALSGDINLVSQGVTTVNNLTISEGCTVSLKDETDSELLIKVEDTLTAGGSATLLANLEMLNDSAYLSNGVQKALSIGSELTMGTGIQLDEATLKALDAMEIGQTFWLIGAADGSPMEYNGDAERYEEVFSREAYNGGYTLQNDFNIAFDETNGFGLTMFSKVPEPTTGTLSLLALAALAARRRRH